MYNVMHDTSRTCTFFVNTRSIKLGLSMQLENYNCSIAVVSAFPSTGRHCYDVNECEKVPKVCINEAYCTNLIGSYTCTCSDGFRQTGPNSCEGGFCCDSAT